MSWESLMSKTVRPESLWSLGFSRLSNRHIDAEKGEFKGVQEPIVG